MSSPFRHHRHFAAPLHALARAVLVAVWLLAALGSSAAEAQDREGLQSARDLMEKGQELYLQGKYIEAAERFEAAFDVVEHAAFLYNAAMAYEKSGDPDKAANYFTRYLEQAPDADDAAAVRERIEKLRTQALEAEGPQEGTEPTEGEGEGTAEGAEPTEGEGEGAAEGEGAEPGEGEGAAEGEGEGAAEGEGEGAAEGEGEGAAEGEGATATPTVDLPEPRSEDMKSLLSVQSNPPNAQVSVEREGAKVAGGGAPFLHTLPQGEYRIVVEHPDYRTIEETVRVGPGKVYVFIVEMSQGEFVGHLRVVTDPPGAKVFVDNREEGAAGETPWQSTISTGQHRVWIEKGGFEPEERTVEVQVGEEKKLQVGLTRVDHGRLQVVANVSSATVFVDDRKVGQVPYEGEHSPGPHRVRVEADDNKDWEQTVEVHRGQLTPVRVRLRPAMARGDAWTSAVLSAVFLGGGIGLTVKSNSLESQLRNDAEAGRLASDDDRIQKGKILTWVADAAYGIAALTALLSVYYFVRDPLPDSEGTVLEPRDWELTPEVGPEGASAHFRWSF